MERLLRLVRELVPAPIWSAGVELARTFEIVEVPSTTAGERTFRIAQGPRDRAVTVSLCDEDEAWQSDCSCSDDPCRHVVGAILGVKQGKSSLGPARRPGAATGRVLHEFTREGHKLAFRRFLDWGERRAEVTGSLSAALRAIRPGEPGVLMSRDDEQIDHVLPGAKSGVLDPKTMRHLCAVLARGGSATLDGSPCAVSGTPARSALEVLDDGDGFLVRLKLDGDVTEVFENGVGVRGDVVCPLSDDGLTADEWRAYRGEGRRFARGEAAELVSAVIPSLEGRVEIVARTSRLPRAVRTPPRVVIETVADAEGSALTIIPRLVYGDPPIAELRGSRIELIANTVVPVRDRVEESRLVRDLQTRLFLKLDEAKVFRGEDAVVFTQRLAGWKTIGDGRERFTPASGMSPVLITQNNAVILGFETGDGRTASGEGVAAVVSRGGRYVRLDDGGWAELPGVWLAAHREAALRLLNARDNSTEIRAEALADLEEVCDSLSIPYPEYLKRLREGLEHSESIGDAPLPTDLQANLRPYQRVGVNWLSFMRTHKFGALLADDMGLGKTVQAITVMAGKTLVVAPTSVIHSWEDQVNRFRPSLTVCRYHGNNRVLRPDADLIVTTYALLRMEIETFESIEWDTIILDESQLIRNPDSQVARAAYRLKGAFKISLSGTPVENSLEDLWSQFHFLNPGLLGSRSGFEESFASKIRQGDPARAQALRKRVAPFMLRRLKRDVELDLPPKTEVVLECELDPSERAVYEGVLAASRPEVLAHLDGERDLLSVLEVLLRLRQACCHSALVPGQVAEGSSKISLLVESLERSILHGHRALVFSQWTSLLDLIEPALSHRSISWSRIDGSTEDRASVVRGFQQEDGPSVLLLSLKAGGVGLNLTAADHVYILDPWWNPAVEDQAADRAYRIGQERPVIVHRLVARGTVEERVLALQGVKRQLGASVLEGSQGIGLTREDILNLIGE